MIVIFEDSLVISDHEYIGISYMLEKSLGDYSVVFAQCNDRVKGKLLSTIKIRENNESIIVFIDLIADNHNTWGIYESLIKVILKYNFENVYVIPIVCSEHIFNMAFNRYITNSECAYAIKDRCKYKHLINCKSYEKFCKKVLRLYKDKSIYENIVDEGKYSFYSCDTYDFGMELEYGEKLDVLSESLLGNIDTNIVDVIYRNFQLFLKQVADYESDAEYNTWDASAIVKCHNMYMEYLRSYKDDVIEAMEESIRIANDPNVKKYTDVHEMFNEILKDE
jgi:hypothetical protein